MTTPRKVWLSGAGGFIGHHVLEHIFTSTDWAVTATDSFRHKGVTDRIRQVLTAGPDSWRQRLDVYTHDLTAPVSGIGAAFCGQPDYMIAMASESHVDRSITDPGPFIANNVSLMVNTLELARVLKPRKVIVISTDEVYGPEPYSGPHPEWAPVLPSNPYAASKAAQEAIAIAYWRTYGVPVIIVNCFDMETRVMTPDGPKRHDQLRLGDRVWAMDAEGRMIAEPVTQLFRRPGPRTMVRIRAKGSSQLVTHDHRIMFQRPAGKPRRWQPVEETTAGQLLGMKGRIRIPRTAAWEGHNSPVVYPYDHFTPPGDSSLRFRLPEEMPSAQAAALFGWYISEGTSNGRGLVRLYGDKPGQRDLMKAALAGIQGTVRDVEPRPHPASPGGLACGGVEISNADLADWLRVTAGRLQPERRVPKFVKGMSAEYLRVFFEAAMAGDGTKYANGGSYYTSSERLAYDMAEVAVKLGFSARISTRETWNPAKTLKKLSWIMRYSPCAGEVEARNVTEEAYGGDVWCLSVASSRVFIERDGIVSLSGQCMNLIGERQDPEKFVPLVTRKVIRGETVTVHGREGDIGTRHYLHARNLADGLVFLLDDERPLSMFPAHARHYQAKWFKLQARLNQRPDRYNIASADRVSNLALAQMIAAAAGKPLKYELEDFHTTRPGHDPHYGLDPRKMTAAGWTPPVPLETSLKKTVEWSLAHPQWLGL